MATDYADFITTVEHQAAIPHDEAERAARATLETLAERISPGEAHDIAEQLPEPLRAVLDRADPPHPFSAQEFLQRVQARERVPIRSAERHVRAVFAALRESVSRDELADLASELPRELEMLLFDDTLLPELEDASAGPMAADEFIDRVARRTALDRDEARRVVDVVLEALAERIAGGEVADIAERLPAELRAPLERGSARSGDSARWLPLKQFLMAIADREGVTRAQARLHVRAVLATLREAVGEQELRDVASELPHEYRSLMPRA